jgi:hypothetical protein
MPIGRSALPSWRSGVILVDRPSQRDHRSAEQRSTLSYASGAMGLAAWC